MKANKKPNALEAGLALWGEEYYAASKKYKSIVKRRRNKIIFQTLFGTVALLVFWLLLYGFISV